MTGAIEAISRGGFISISLTAVLLAMSIISLTGLAAELFRLKREFRTLPRDGQDPAAGTSWAIMHDHVAQEQEMPSDIQKIRLNALCNKISSGGEGMSTILASIGSNAPYVGLLGTVVGVYGALKTLGLGSLVTMQDVAAPVGEALAMTALGLFVAIPAVFGYNFVIRLRRRHESLLEAYALQLQGRIDGASLRQLQQSTPALLTFKRNAL